MTWKEITTSDDYKSLPDDLRSDIKRTYFDSNIAPGLAGATREDVALAFQDWMETPDDTGEGLIRSALGSAARGFFDPLAAAPEVAGAYLGIEGLEEFGGDVRGAIEGAFPVNPAEQGLVTDVAGVLGQVGQIVATGGGGAVAGAKLIGRGATEAAKRQAMRFGATAAQQTAMGSSAVAGGLERAEQLGLDGGDRLLRGAIAGGTELLAERLGGFATELGGVGKAAGFADTVESGFMKPIIRGIGTEAGEEGLAEAAGQATDIAMAPEAAPGMDLKNIGYAMLLGGVGGAAFGGIEAAITPRTKKAFEFTEDFTPSTTPPPGMTRQEADDQDLLVYDNVGNVIGYKTPQAPVTAETIEAELPVEIAPVVAPLAQNVAATPEASATAAALRRIATEGAGAPAATQEIPDEIVTDETTALRDAGLRMLTGQQAPDNEVVAAEIIADEPEVLSAEKEANATGRTLNYQGNELPYTVNVAQVDGGGYKVTGIKVQLGNGFYERIPFPQDEQTSFASADEARSAADQFVQASSGNALPQDQAALEQQQPTETNVPLTQETLQQEQSRGQELQEPRELPILPAEPTAQAPEAAVGAEAAELEQQKATLPVDGEGAMLQGGDVRQEETQEQPDRLMDVPSTMQYIYQQNLSKTDTEKVKKLLEKNEKEARKQGRIQGARSFYESDVNTAIEEVMASKQDSAEFRKKLETAKRNKDFSPELSSLLDSLEVEEASLRGIQSEKGMFGVQWAERNVRTRETNKKKEIRALKERIVAISPSEIALKAKKPTQRVSATADVPTESLPAGQLTSGDVGTPSTNATPPPQAQPQPDATPATQETKPQAAALAEVTATQESTAAQPAAEETGDAVAARPLARSKPRETIAFKRPIRTPLGDVVAYSWSSQLIEDVDKDGEPVFRRISNWEEAATNAETGRDIVHRFTIRKKDGSFSEVSLESTMGALSGDMKKTMKSVISAAKRLPFMRAELAELESKKAAADADYAKTSKMQPARDKLTLSEPDTKWMIESGKKKVELDGVFSGYLSSNEITSDGKPKNFGAVWNDALWKWQGAQRTVILSSSESERMDSLRRRIKKAEILLKNQGVEVAPLETSQPEEAGPPVRNIETPVVTTAPLASFQTPEQIEAKARKNIEALDGELKEKALNNLGEGTPKLPGFLRLQRTLDDLDARAPSMTQKEWNDNIYFNSPVEMMRWGYSENRPLTRQEAEILNELRNDFLSKREYAPVTGKKIKESDWPVVSAGDFPTVMQYENLTGQYNQGRDVRPDFALWNRKRSEQFSKLRAAPSDVPPSDTGATDTALSKLQSYISTLSPKDQQLWTPERLAAAEGFYNTGNRSLLDIMPRSLRNRVYESNVTESDKDAYEAEQKRQFALRNPPAATDSQFLEDYNAYVNSLSDETLQKERESREEAPGVGDARYSKQLESLDKKHAELEKRAKAGDKAAVTEAERMVAEAATRRVGLPIKDASEIQTEAARATNDFSKQIDFFQRKLDTELSLEREKAAIAEARANRGKWIEAGLNPNSNDPKSFLAALDAGLSPVKSDEDIKRSFEIERNGSLKEIQKYTTMSEKFAGKQTTTQFETGSGFVARMYHATPFGRLTTFDAGKLGTLTGAPSATKAHFFAGDPKVSETYFGDDSLYLKHKGFLSLTGNQKKELVDAIRGEFGDLDSASDQDVEDTALALFDEIDSYDTSPIDNVLHEVFVSMKNPLVFDFKGSGYREQSFSDLIDKAIENGHDGVVFANTYDAGPAAMMDDKGPSTNVFAVIAGNENQIKSADPFTYSEDGKLIPLSERFQPDSPDIRYKKILRSADGSIRRTGVKSTPARAARNSYIGVIPGVESTWLGTVEEFDAEFPDGYEFGGTVTRPPDDSEALTAADGRPFIFLDRVAVLDGDAERAEAHGTSPGVEAIKRLLRHESFIHRGYMALPGPLKNRFADFVASGIIPPEDLDYLANNGYPHYKGWRDSKSTEMLAAEEWLAQRVERMGRIPQSGPIASIMDWLRDVWRWLTGGETTDLDKLRNTMRAMHKALGALDPKQRIVMELPDMDVLRRSVMRGVVSVELGDDAIAQINIDTASINYESKTNPNAFGRLETSEGPNGEIIVENHSLDEELRGSGIGGLALKKLQELTGKTIISDEYPSESARAMWERLGAKREKVQLSEDDIQKRYVLRPSSNIRFSKVQRQSVAQTQQDQEYLAAVERGDMKTAQRMVDEAARAAGYNVGPVYHGTNADFTVFDVNRSGQNYTPHYGKGISFASTPMHAFDHGKKVKSFFLKASNPLTHSLSVQQDAMDRGIDSSEIAKSGGHDSIVVPNGYKGSITETIVFDSNQIKSADPVTYDSNGAPIPLSQRFQSTSSDIRYSKVQRPVIGAQVDALSFPGVGITSQKNPMAFEREYGHLPAKYYKMAEKGQVADALQGYAKETVAPYATSKEKLLELIEILRDDRKILDTFGIGATTGQAGLGFIYAEGALQAEKMGDRVLTEAFAFGRKAVGTSKGQGLVGEKFLVNDQRYQTLFAVGSIDSTRRNEQQAVVNAKVGKPTAAKVGAEFEGATEAARDTVADAIPSELQISEKVLELGAAVQGNPTLTERVKKLISNVIDRGRKIRALQKLKSQTRASIIPDGGDFENMSEAELEAEIARLTKEIEVDMDFIEKEAAKTPRTQAPKTPVETAKAIINRVQKQAAGETTRAKPKLDRVRLLYKAHLRERMAEADFMDEAKAAGLTPQVAQELYDAAELEIAAILLSKEVRGKSENYDKLTRERLKHLDVDSSALVEYINRLRREGKLGPVNWRDIMQLPPTRQQVIKGTLLELVKQSPQLQNLSAEEQQTLADALEKVWERERERQFKLQVKRLEMPGAKQEDQEKVVSATPRIIKLINQGMLAEDAFYKAVGEQFGIKEMSDADRKRIMELSEIIQDGATPEADKAKEVRELVTLLQKYHKLTTAEILSNVWVAHVLSGVRTQFDMAMGFQNGFLNTVKKAGLVIYKNPNAKGAKTAAKGIQQFFVGLVDGMAEAARYVRTEEPGLVRSDIEFINSYFEGGLKKGGLSTARKLRESDNKFLSALGSWLAILERVNTGWDVITYRATYQGTLAMAHALNPKIYKEALMPTTADFRAMEERAKTMLGANATRAQIKSRAFQYIEDGVHLLGKNLDESFMQEWKQMATEFNYDAKEAAMMVDPTGIGGLFYRGIMGLTEKAETKAKARADKAKEELLDPTLGRDQRFIRQVFPPLMYLLASQARNIFGFRFVRFTGNKINELISYIPIAGMARIYLEEGMYRNNELTIKAMSVQMNQLIATAIMIPALVQAWFDLEDDDEERGYIIQGPWDNLTPERKSQLMADGFKPNTIAFYDKKTGRWTSYNYINWPSAGWFATAGSVSDYRRYTPEKWDEKTAAAKFMSGIYAGGSSFLDISSISQMTELFGRSTYSTDPATKGLEKVTKLATGYAGGFVPRIAKDVDSWFDKTVYKPEDTWGHIAKEVPFYRRNTGAPLRDIFYGPVQVSRTPWSRALQVSPDDPAYKALGRLNSRGIWLTPANPENRKVKRGGKLRDMTDEEANAYMAEVGKRYKEFVVKQGDRLLEMDVDRAEELVSKYTARIREIAFKRAIATAGKAAIPSAE